MSGKTEERWKKGDRLRDTDDDRRRGRQGRDLRSRLDTALNLRSRFEKGRRGSDREESPEEKGSRGRKKDKYVPNHI